MRELLGYRRSSVRLGNRHLCHYETQCVVRHWFSVLCRLRFPCTRSNGCNRGREQCCWCVAHSGIQLDTALPRSEWTCYRSRSISLWRHRRVLEHESVQKLSNADHSEAGHDRKLRAILGVQITRDLIESRAPDNLRIFFEINLIHSSRALISRTTTSDYSVVARLALIFPIGPLRSTNQRR